MKPHTHTNKVTLRNISILVTSLFLLIVLPAKATVIVGINNLTTNTYFTVVASYWKLLNSDGSDTGGRETGPGELPPPGGYAETHNDDPYAGQGFSYHLEYEVTGTTAVQTYDSGYMAAGSYTSLFLNGVTAPCFTNVTFSGVNNTLDTRVVFIATCAGCTHEAESVVQPGGPYTLVANVPCDVASSESLFNYVIYTPPPPNPPTNQLPSAPTPNGNINSPTPTTYDPSNNGNGTNGNSSPILYTSTNPVTSQQQGDAALYDAVTKAAIQAHQDAQEINTGVNGIYTNAAAVALANSLFLSNVLSHGLSITGAIASVTVTNTGYGFTNYNLQNTQEGISNVLSTLSSNLMIFGTNVLTLAQLKTNQQDNLNTLSNLQAQALANTNQGSSLQALLITPMQAIPAGWGADAPPIDSPSSPNLSIEIAPGVSGTLSSARNPSVYNLARTLIAWIIYLIVFISCWKIFYQDYFNIVMTPQTRTAGTEMFGSNINMVSAIACAGAILGLLAAVATYAVSHLINYMFGIQSVGGSNPIGGFSGIGFEWINAYVPLTLMYSAIGVVFVFRLSVDILAFAATVVIKLLVGV